MLIYKPNNFSCLYMHKADWGKLENIGLFTLTNFKQKSTSIADRLVYYLFVTTVRHRLGYSHFTTTEKYFFGFSFVCFSGVKSESPWEPSQKGCLSLLPQEYQNNFYQIQLLSIWCVRYSNCFTHNCSLLIVNEHINIKMDT